MSTPTGDAISGDGSGSPIAPLPGDAYAVDAVPLAEVGHRGCVERCDPSQCDHSSTGGCCDLCGAAK